MQTPAQIELFRDEREPVFKPETELEFAFYHFHEQNPHVYRRLVEMARALKARGVERFGIATIYESLRYEGLLTNSPDYKLNNNYKAPYSTMIADNCPDLADVFRRRPGAKDKEPDYPPAPRLWPGIVLAKTETTYGTHPAGEIQVLDRIDRINQAVITEVNENHERNGKND